MTDPSTHDTSTQEVIPVPAATQVRHPWKATVRTVFAATVALLTLLPYVVSTADIPEAGVIAQLLIVAGAVTRVLALPQVEEFLEQFLPFLAAKPADTNGETR